MANYSKYTKNGNLNVQKSTLGDWLKSLVTPEKEEKKEREVISYKNGYNADGSYTSPTGKTYSAQYMEEQQKKAQQYAQAALNGTSNVYVPASQTANAMINAQVPVKTQAPVQTQVQSSKDSNAVVVQDDSSQKYLEELQRQRELRQAELDRQYQLGRKSIEDAAADSNRQAYISYMRGLKNMPQAAAMYGRGGMAQSLANKSQLNYENQRNNIEVNKLGRLADLENDYRAGAVKLADEYLAKADSNKAKTQTAKAATSGKTQQTYRIGNNKTVHNSLEDVIMELMNLGFTRQQAVEYVGKM